MTIPSGASTLSVTFCLRQCGVSFSFRLTTVTHIQALPGKPYDGHTLETVIPAIETQVGATLSRIIADAGYKGHNAPQTHRFKVYTAGQKRGMTEHIKRQMRRRSAIEPVIGHLKEDHRMGRNHLAGPIGDAANAVLAAVGYNFRRILAWIRFCLAIIWAALTLYKLPDPIFQASNATPAIG